MKNLISSTLIILALSILPSCGGTATVRDFNPERDEQTRAIIFGYFKINYAGRDATYGATVHFDNGEKLSLDRDGFAVAHVHPGASGIRKITIANGSGTEYTMPNLRFRAGFAGTKTYFGNITLNIYVPPKNAPDVAEKWSWQVENQWKTAWLQWNRLYGTDKRKFYSSLAEKTGPDKVQTRALATDRQEVVPGF